MTCQHCQTWNLDDDHRCLRCGRRTNLSPARISPDTYPIAATATARAYDFDEESLEEASPAAPPLKERPQGQQPLFATQPDPRVVQFDAFTSPENRESIRARAADLSRPPPLKTSKNEVSPRRVTKEGSRLNASAGQQRLDLFAPESVSAQTQSSIRSDAPVAPVGLRMQAAAIDGGLMALAWILGAVVFRVAGGALTLDKHTASWLIPVLASIPVLYKSMWAFAGRDTVGMRSAGLRTVDFDGNTPSRERRYIRLFGSFLSVLAAGTGLLWVYVDQDGLAWHDYMSSTFPTILDSARP